MSLPCGIFHVSPVRFDRPSLEVGQDILLTTGEAQAKNAKGSLGLWVSPYPEFCRFFGPEVASLGFADDTRYGLMSVEKLMALHASTKHLEHGDQVRAYADLRRVLAEQCDVLLIEDSSVKVGEVVVLNLDVVDRWDWIDGYDFKVENQSCAFDEIDVDRRACQFIARCSFDESGNVNMSASTLSHSRVAC